MRILYIRFFFIPTFTNVLVVNTLKRLLLLPLCTAFVIVFAVTSSYFLIVDSYWMLHRKCNEAALTKKYILRFVFFYFKEIISDEWKISPVVFRISGVTACYHNTQVIMCDEHNMHSSRGLRLWFAFTLSLKWLLFSGASLKRAKMTDT